MNIANETYAAKTLNKINIILGKNGTGKSTILKGLLNSSDDAGQTVHIEYITPERGGHLKYDSGVESSIDSNPAWVTNTRKVNQITNFKEQTLSRYVALQLKILSTLSKKLREDFLNATTPEENAYTFFEKNIESINTLLENIEIRTTGDKGFQIYKKGTNDLIEPKQISSGESELISLAIECLYFQKSNSVESNKVLLIDEPDVHLHPDLQVKFMRFIHELATESGSEFIVIIATHSTAFLGALEDTKDVNLAFIKSGQTEINFSPIIDVYKEILPVFGAHPLSNIFNETPILLLEGEDDERIWQTAVRSSHGLIKVYPCVCGNNVQITRFETEVKKIINSIYDEAKAYSLRDRDGTPEEDMLDDLPIIKHKLRCYAAENLLLSDEVLKSLGVTWLQLIEAMNEWISEKTDKEHKQLEEMIAFQDGGYNRKNVKIKNLRNLLLGIMGSEKPWEVAVGNVIATLRWDPTTDYANEDSIFNYLGKKLTESILPQAE